MDIILGKCEFKNSSYFQYRVLLVRIDITS